MKTETTFNRDGQTIEQVIDNVCVASPRTPFQSGVEGCDLMIDGDDGDVIRVYGILTALLGEPTIEQEVPWPCTIYELGNAMLRVEDEAEQAIRDAEVIGR